MTLKSNVAAQPDEALNGELPIDLEVQIDMELQAADLLMTTLQHRPLTSETAALIDNTVVIRDQLSLLKARIATAYARVFINPSDDDYLALTAINGRLEKATRKPDFLQISIDDQRLLMKTIKQGLQIADNLTSP